MSKPKLKIIEQPLDYLTTDQLLEELGKRFNSLVFMGLKDIKADRMETKWRIGGCPYRALGMLNFIQLRLMNGVNESNKAGEREGG